MAINYEQVGWDSNKYVNPTNMNKMDNGIKAACDKVDAHDQQIDTLNSNLNNHIKDNIVFKYINGDTLEQSIIKNWDKLPKGNPFIASFICLGIGFIAGYVYEDGLYGSVIVLSYGTIFIIKCNNGEKTVISLN